MIAVVFVTLGLVFLGLAVFNVWQGVDQDRWVQAKGIVIQSAVDDLDETFAAAVRYQYEVGSLSFIGDTVRSGQLQYNWSGPARRICAKYPVGTSVSVYYDPKNPRLAVLECGGSVALRVTFALVAVACFLLAGVIHFASA